jgi:hypothetical protein
MDFTKNRLQRMNAGDTPPPLRRDLRPCIVEARIIGLEETIVNLVQPVVKNLPGIFVAVWNRGGPDEPSTTYIESGRRVSPASIPMVRFKYSKDSCEDVAV